MNYDIYIKGHRDPIAVKDGEEIKRDWERYIETREDAVVSFGNFTGRLSDIKNFRKAQGSSADNKVSEKAHEDYLDVLREKRSLSPEERSKHLGFFRLFFFGFTQEKSEDFPEIEKKAIEIQQKFFERNPKRTVCDPSAFRGAIDFKELKKIEASVMRVIEGVVRQDVFAEKHL